MSDHNHAPAPVDPAQLASHRQMYENLMHSGVYVAGVVIIILVLMLIFLV